MKVHTRSPYYSQGTSHESRDGECSASEERAEAANEGRSSQRDRRERRPSMYVKSDSDTGELCVELNFLMYSAAKIVFQTLRDQTAYNNSRSLSVYLSMPSGEISTDAIVRDALESGKRVFVPYFYKATEPAEGSPKSIMDMVQLSSLHDYENLEPDKWGIPTPSKESIAERNNSFGGTGKSENISQTSQLSTENALDLILLPAMAFDRRLGRLGHGKGFYDYFLHRTLGIYASKGIGMPRLGKTPPSRKELQILVRRILIRIKLVSHWRSKFSPQARRCLRMRLIGKLIKCWLATALPSLYLENYKIYQILFSLRTRYLL